MQSIEEKVRVQLHLERVELTGRQGLLVFCPLQLLEPGSPQVTISMRSQDRRNINGDNVRKSIMNEQQRTSLCAREKALCGTVPQRKNHPTNTGVAEHVGHCPEAAKKQIPQS